MNLGITGWSVVTAAGIGVDAFAGALAAPPVARPVSDVGGLYDDPLPAGPAHALVDLNARRILGRKGTASLDRRTVLALIACRDALSDGRVTVDENTRHRVGVALGTTWGSLKAMSDYTKDSLLEERPYLVEPSRFPNTVMNCAAGHAAIWYGLKGVNATIAGGDVAFLNVMHYTNSTLRCGYADTMLAGAVEELTPHTAWAEHLGHNGHAAEPPGEAAAVFVMERADEARIAGRHVDAEILSVAIGFVHGGRAGGQLSRALEGCVRRVLDSAGVAPSSVAMAATAHAENGEPETEALAAVFKGSRPERIAPATVFGDSGAASGALQLAAVLSRHLDRSLPDGAVSLLTGYVDDGAVGAALLKGWCRGSAHRE